MLYSNFETFFYYGYAYLNAYIKPEVKFANLTTNTNVLLAHRMLPSTFWTLKDAIMIIGLLMTVSIYEILFAKKGLENKFVMYLFVDKKSGKIEIVQNGKGEFVLFLFVKN